jgi:iron complex outermembrane receptor protein
VGLVHRRHHQGRRQDAGNLRRTQRSALKGLPFAENVELSLSGRHTEVNSYGEDDTYKIGLNWQLVPSLRLRATKGTSFRAPALFELYKNAETSFLSQRTVDPCIRWAQNLAQGSARNTSPTTARPPAFPGAYTGAGATATITSGGGKGNLEAETSKAMTYGVIWTPSFADLNVAVDYFDIDVNNEITQLGAAGSSTAAIARCRSRAIRCAALFSRGPVRT